MIHSSSPSDSIVAHALGSIFQSEYDPLYVILRCTKRAHFQNSLERFTNL